MLGMVANAEITAPSLAVFVRGTHEVGAFIELLAQHQRETENKKKENKFWILHVCIFRLAYGHVTSGEMVDPSSGIRTTMSPNLEASIKPHPAPLATTQADTDNNISEIDGSCDVESCALLMPTSGADNYDVHRLGLAKTRMDPSGRFSFYLHTLGQTLIMLSSVSVGSSFWPPALNIR